METDNFHNSNETIGKRNLPFNQPNNAKARSGEEDEEEGKPPVLAIILTSLCVMFVVIVLVIVWVYARRRKQSDVMQLKWKELDSNKVCKFFKILGKGGNSEMLNHPYTHNNFLITLKEIYENDDISKQLREKSETIAIMDDVSDETEEGAKDANAVVYNGSTVLSFHSNS